MNEGMLVADLQAGNPPVLHVRMVAVGDMDALPSAEPAFVAVIEELQPVQIVQIPDYRCPLTIDFECVERFVPAGITRRLESSEGAVLESGKKRAGVIDPYWFFLAREIMFPGLDERFRHSGPFIDLAVQPHSGINIVCQEVACDTATRDACVQAPQCLAALSKIARNGPVLQKHGAIVKNFAEQSFVDQLF